MLDTSEKLEVCAEELGYPTEQLITPLTGRTNTHPERHFCIDNGAYSQFPRKRFEAILAREYKRRALCRFVAVPDVVGSARRTLEVFDYWFPLISNWNLALVAQDGQEDLPIPWEHIQAVFIGGTTKFKESQGAIQIIKAAQAQSKWVHVGRVNDPTRFEAFRQLGVDSVDGSGIAQYTWMRERLGSSPSLFTRSEMVINV